MILLVCRWFETHGLNDILIEVKYDLDLDTEEFWTCVRYQIVIHDFYPNSMRRVQYQMLTERALQEELQTLLGAGDNL